MAKNNKLKFLLVFWLLLFTFLVSAQQSNQFYLITLNYKKIMFAESLSLIDINTTKGSVSDNINKGADYSLEVVSSPTEILKTMEFGIPTGSNNLNFSISVPYFKNGKIINIYDKNKNKALEIPLKEELKINLNWVYVTIPIILVIGFLVYIELKRKREHAELIQQRENQKIMILRNYVITNLRRGYSKEQIRNALIKNNYNNEKIEGAFRGL